MQVSERSGLLWPRLFFRAVLSVSEGPPGVPATESVGAESQASVRALSAVNAENQFCPVQNNQCQPLLVCGADCPEEGSKSDDSFSDPCLDSDSKR